METFFENNSFVNLIKSNTYFKSKQRTCVI